MREAKSRNWPVVSAKIDDFTVGEGTGLARRRTSTWVVTLRYTFHNPEIEIGKYVSPDFYERGDAEAWANSFKWSTVMVHVDPRDPSRSVLRKEDLDNAVSPAPVAERT